MATYLEALDWIARNQLDGSKRIGVDGNPHPETLLTVKMVSELFDVAPGNVALNALARASGREYETDLRDQWKAFDIKRQAKLWDEAAAKEEKQ